MGQQMQIIARNPGFTYHYHDPVEHFFGKPVKERNPRVDFEREIVVGGGKVQFLALMVVAFMNSIVLC